MGIKTRTSGIMIPAWVLPASGGSTGDADVDAWVAAVIAAGGTVSATQKTNVKNMVTSLKGHNLWTKLDRIWLFAGETVSQQALIDVKNLNGNGGTPLSISGAPALATAGYTGNGASSFIASNFNPTTAAGNFTQNAASFGIYYMADHGGAGVSLGAFDGAIFVEVIDSTVNCFINNAAGDSAGDSGAGLFHADRSSSTLITVYKNGTTTGATDPTATSGLLNAEIYILARNNSGADSFGNAQVGCVYLGGSFTAGEISNLATDVNTYMTAWGVNTF